MADETKPHHIEYCAYGGRHSGQKPTSVLASIGHPHDAVIFPQAIQQIVSWDETNTNLIVSMKETRRIFAHEYGGGGKGVDQHCPSYISRGWRMPHSSEMSLGGCDASVSQCLTVIGRVARLRLTTAGLPKGQETDRLVTNIFDRWICKADIYSRSSATCHDGGHH